MKPEPAPAAPVLPRQRETALRRRLVARDEQALVELIELASPWLLGVTQGMLSDPDEAEEVVLEVFTAAWNRIGAPGRRARGAAALAAPDRPEPRDRPPAPARARSGSSSPGRGLGRACRPTRVARGRAQRGGPPGWHVHESVHAALAALPPEQREAVQLAYFRGLTHSEIAKQLAIPMGTVKTRLRLAFDKLRVALAPIKDWIA